MTEASRSTDSHAARDAPNGPPDAGRRSFLLLLPAVILAGMAATLAAAAFRFLRPLAIEEVSGARWTDVARLAELRGSGPLARRIRIERRAGWAVAEEERTVYVLPQQSKRVVSAICPHERCEVAWRAAEGEFFCPCHESRFDSAGELLSGPARRGLDPLPARIENGVLQVQYLSPDGGETRAERGAGG